MGEGFPAKGYDGQGLDKFLKKGHRTSGGPAGQNRRQRIPAGPASPVRQGSYVKEKELPP